jgi:endonuclease III
LKESLEASTLSSPPATPLLRTTKRKRVSGSKKSTEAITGGWDVLPHGLGKKNDLVEDTAAPVSSMGDSTPPPKKRARRGRNAAPVKGAGENGLLVSETKGSRGRAKKVEPATPESSAIPARLESVASTPIKKSSSKRGKAAVKIEAVDDVHIQEGFLQEAESTKKSASPKKETLDSSEDVLKKVDDLVDESKKATKTPRKKKHRYGLTPGSSPFPDYAKPTPEDCEEVNRLLSELHGEVKQPETIPPPSMDVTGCGEVPDLLDAILRTRLSASTTAKNSNMALKGLKDKFGLRTSGVGAGSVNWEAVHKAKLDEIILAIKSGGLAVGKGTDIKNILGIVHTENCARRDALLHEKETGEPAEILGAKHATEEQKEAEILRANESLLSMDHVFEMTTDEAMEEMTKLPGIGVKTASCVILFCMKRPSFAVDTHVWRHCKWLGWVPEKAKRDQTFSHCEVRVPDHLKYSLHQLFLRHGKACPRCKGGASSGSKLWEETVCPIEHLVNRAEGKKKGARSPTKKKAAGHSGKKKAAKKGESEDETGESDVTMTDLSGEE